MGHTSQFLFIVILICFTTHYINCFESKLCINSDYMSNGQVLSKESCKIRPCIISTCPQGQIDFNEECLDMASLNMNYWNFSNIFKNAKAEADEIVDTLSTFEPNLLATNDLNKEYMAVDLIKDYAKNIIDNFQIVTFKDETAYFKNKCTTPFYKVGGDGMHGYFLEDGSFYLSHRKTTIPAGDYIVKFHASDEDDDGTLKAELLVKFAVKIAVADHKFDSVTRAVDDMYSKLSPLFFDCGLFISCSFLILTIFVVLRKVRFSTISLIFVSYLASLAVLMLLVAARHQAMIRHVLNSNGCYGLSTAIHFFTFSSFIWMNIIGFHILWIIRNPKNFYYPPCKLPLNLCLAFLPSLLYVLAEVLMDTYTKNGPNFRFCTARSSVWYLAGPLMPIQTLNLIILSLIIYHLHFGKYLASVRLRTKASLCLKVAIVMGSTWVTDLMLLLFDSELNVVVSSLMKTFNALYGVILFLVVAFNRSALLEAIEDFGEEKNPLATYDKLDVDFNTYNKGAKNY